MLLLARNLDPKIVSEVLGHATIAITLDTYSHVLPNVQDSAARALEDALRLNGLQYGCSMKPRATARGFHNRLSFTCKVLHFRSRAEGIRTPYPSAVQKRHDTLLEMSGACKTAANIRIF
jgi:hypothetical protein